MVERSLCMREVQGSMPCSSIFFIDEEKLFSGNSRNGKAEHRFRNPRMQSERSTHFSPEMSK